jgi:hypothetical protein
VTARFTVSIDCECGCGPELHGCLHRFPDQPVEGTAKKLRASADLRGWEIRRGNAGRDVCPSCRIAAIHKAMTPAEQGKPA